jgi:hypothetical protein
LYLAATKPWIIEWSLMLSPNPLRSGTYQCKNNATMSRALGLCGYQRQVHRGLRRHCAKWTPRTTL